MYDKVVRSTQVGLMAPSNKGPKIAAAMGVSLDTKNVNANVNVICSYPTGNQ